MSLAQTAIRVGEAIRWPDPVSSLVIDRLVDRTRRKLQSMSGDADVRFAETMAKFPIAINTAEANTQHYEMPARFFELVLGPQRKYSSCLYESDEDTLADAEERALAVTAEHACLQDGQDILELGCGWGSLSLWMARRYPNSRITSVSNSNSQREYITRIAQNEHLENLNVVTSDMNTFVPPSGFDRVVSVEMFEHMINWRPLLARIKMAMRPQGYLFLHVFSHRASSYRFDTEDRDDWIAQHFFTGGIMPSHGLIRQFPDLFALEQEWRWSGSHYARTAQDWLSNYDRNAVEISTLLKQVYGTDARLWERRWRLFFLATKGLFENSGGEEWGISHYRLVPTP